MVEEAFQLSRGDEKAIERVVQDENIHYLHMVFRQNEGLPEHYSNSNVYMTILRDNYQFNSTIRMFTCTAPGVSSKFRIRRK